MLPINYLVYSINNLVYSVNYLVYSVNYLVYLLTTTARTNQIGEHSSIVCGSQDSRFTLTTFVLELCPQSEVVNCPTTLRKRLQ